MTSECIMKCQLFENLIKMTPFHLQYVTLFQTKKKNIYFQLQNEKFWLNVQDTYLAAFIQKNYFLFHLSKYHAILSDPY